MPTITASLDWVFWLTGAVMAIGAIALLIWSVFRDRGRKGRFRCPKCWYDLTRPEGAPALPVMCTECGRTTAKLRNLHKRRRRYRYALVALLMLPAAGAVAYYPIAQRNGWMSMIPSRMLIDTMPIFGYPSPVTREFVRRTGGSPLRMDPDARVYLLERVARGNVFARPGSGRWRESYGAFALGDGRYFFGTYETDSATPIQRESVLTALEQIRQLPPYFALRTRPVWPEHVPLYIEEDARFWPLFNISLSRDVELAGSPDRWRIGEMLGLVVARNRLQSAGVLEFRAKVEKTIRLGGQSEATQFEYDAKVPYVIRGNTDDLLTPVADPAIDAMVASIRYALRDNGYADCMVNPTCTSATRDLGFGVLMEHIFEGQTRAVERVWWPGGPPPMANARREVRREWITTERLGTTFGQGVGIFPKRGENWSVRIRSDPETALRVIDADKYWEGDVTIPLVIQ